MRAILIICICFLTGCLSDPNKDHHTQLYNVHSLNKPHYYPIPAHSSYLPWWHQFHDPQLEQLIMIGLQDAPNIRSAHNRLLKAQQIAAYYQSPLWPQITFSGYEQRQRFSKTGLVPPPFNGRTFNVAEIGFNFNYEIDFWGKNRNKLAAAANQACAQSAEFAQTRLILSTAIATTYFHWLGYKQQYKIARDMLSERKALLNIIRVKLQRGIETDIPVQTALADVRNSELAVSQYKEAVELTYHQLAALIGKNPLNTHIAAPRFAHHLPEINMPKSIPASLLRNRPDIIANRYLVEANCQEVMLARKGYLPNFNLLALFSYQSIFFNRLLLPENQNNYITGTFDMPIFDGGARIANLGQRAADYEIAVNDYNQTILTALREVADQVTSLKSLNAQLFSQRKMLTNTNNNVRLFTSRYRHGIINYERVIETKELLLSQRLTEVNLITQRILTIINLYKALGGYLQG